jgi:ferredoxin
MTTTLIYFSPTRTTEKVLEAIARGVGSPSVKRVDLTPPDARTRELHVVRDGLAIIGAPVYGGRIPREAESRLGRVRADGVPAAVVAVYGNREYEDALLELRDIAVEAGFVPVAGAAFVGEHSYDRPTTPIASGRPDADDFRRAQAFGAAVAEKLNGLAVLDSVPPLHLPGNSPYRERFEPPPGAPVTRVELCTRCGECVPACPIGAIDARDPLNTDEEACIFCSACVKICPEGARLWEIEWITRVARWLAEEYAARKEPETYL